MQYVVTMVPAIQLLGLGTQATPKSNQYCHPMSKILLVVYCVHTQAGTPSCALQPLEDTHGLYSLISGLSPSMLTNSQASRDEIVQALSLLSFTGDQRSRYNLYVWRKRAWKSRLPMDHSQPSVDFPCIMS